MASRQTKAGHTIETRAQGRAVRAQKTLRASLQRFALNQMRLAYADLVGGRESNFMQRTGLAREAVGLMRDSTFGLTIPLPPGVISRLRLDPKRRD